MLMFHVHGEVKQICFYGKYHPGNMNLALFHFSVHMVKHQTVINVFLGS